MFYRSSLNIVDRPFEKTLVSQTAATAVYSTETFPPLSMCEDVAGAQLLNVLPEVLFSLEELTT